MKDNSRLIVAMDFAELNQALSLADRLEPKCCRLKIGKEMFTRFGPDLVLQLQKMGFDIFLDLKFHDIPHTVARACTAAAELGVWMLNIHTSGGRKMMQAAAKSIAEFADDAPLLIGVTVLTSMTDAEMHETAVNYSIEDRVIVLSRLAQECGLDGVVCSAVEAAALRQQINDNFLLVTPGIRPGGSTVDDQQRIMTPVKALQSGADYLVIGRPITRASDPLKVLCDISESIDTWLATQG